MAISFITPTGEVETIKKIVPNAPVYYRFPNTLVKSILYLTNAEFYDNKYPLKATSMVYAFLRSLKSEKYKKLMQNIHNNPLFDTDPDNNKYFKDFISLLEDNGYNLVIVRCDSNRNFVDTSKVKGGLVLLQKYNGTFSPYGRLKE